ncbi:MAG: c-type cytochrome, partial [Marinobacterium sp.]
MKKTLLGLTAAALMVPATAMAADVNAGKAKYEAVCASCHGSAGKAPIMGSYPKLAGQNAEYL